MKCPKCGHEQENTFECDACGIIFEKYIKRQNEIRDRTTAKRTAETETRSYRHILVFSVLILVLAVVMAVSTKKILLKKGLLKQDMAALSDNSTWNAIPVSETAMSDIEKATAATVFIKTAWGLGSGFFIDTGCRIITNRHVVEPPENLKAKIRDEIEQFSLMIENAEKYIEIQTRRLGNIRDAGRRERIEKTLQNRKNRLESAREKRRAMETRLDTIRLDAYSGSGIEITLYNGTKQSASVLALSETNDLALLETDTDTCVSLSPADSDRLAPGTRVYTIGSPAGLRHTVTSGIVSGRRLIHDNKFIQVDAPINPGNSGGPLINDRGRVIGVNTMIIKNMEGLGFAVPIETVLEDFDEYLD